MKKQHPSVDAIRAGNRLALARTLTLVENNTAEGSALLNQLFPFSGKAHLIGITGAPGTGKSTLVNQLGRFLRQKHPAAKIAIIAVDPSSPFSGGAVLGDRVRMRDLASDAGIFIRSMASRGALGGLAYNTAAAAQVLDGAGYDFILIETVGAGQTEVEIARLAHTVIVVEAPGLGDDIQAIKAGILEIADILVVNKADQSGAENSMRALSTMLQMAQGGKANYAAGKHLLTDETDQVESVEESSSWQPPVLGTIATDGNGIAAVLQEVENHASFLQTSGLWQQRDRQRLKFALDGLLRDALFANWQAKLPLKAYDEIMEKLTARKIAPYTAVAQLLAYNKASEETTA